MIEKNNTSGNTIDLFVINDAKRKRSRQANIVQTWAMLSSIQYTDEDYDAWFADLGIDDIEIEKEVIADAVENVLAVQERFNEECERRRFRRVK